MMKKVIAAAFKSKGKKKMKKNELIYTMSFDLNWFSHEASKKVVEKAENEGLLSGNDEVEPAFDFENIEVSPDFKPNLRELLSRSLADRLVEELAELLGKSYQEVVSIINKKQEEMGNLLSFEVVALLVAKENGLEISKFIEEVEKTVL